MDSDTLYRMIISTGLFIIGIITVGYLWPRKHPQHYYDSPLLLHRVTERHDIGPIDIQTTDTKKEKCLFIIESTDDYYETETHLKMQEKLMDLYNTNLTC